MPAIGNYKGDIQLAYSYNVAGELVVDFALTPQNDFVQAVGKNKLQQLFTRWFYASPGDNCFDPLFGNSLRQFIGRPSDLTSFTIEHVLYSGVNYLIAEQQSDIQQGYLTHDEQLATIDNIVITFGTIPGQVEITFDIITVSGAVTPMTFSL